MPIKRKTALTSFDIVALVAELKAFQGSRLANIYDMPSGGFLFKFKALGRSWLLYAKPGERVHITEYEYAEKGMPSPLVMGFRKYVRESILASVRQHAFDRILMLDFNARGQAYTVVVEVLPRGVMALLDAEGKILQISERKEMKDRVLKHGLTYKPPPSTSVHPEFLEPSFLASKLEKMDGDVVRVLPRALGYPGEVVEEALARLEVSIDTSVRRLDYSTIEDIVGVFRELYNESLSARGYIVYDKNNDPLTVVPFKPLGITKRYGLNFKEFLSFSRALDKYFVEELKRFEEKEHLQAVEAEKKRLLVSIENARRNLDQLRQRLEHTRKLIELIGENIGLVYDAYKCFEEIRDRAGWDNVIGNCPGVVDIKPSEGKIVLNIKGELVELDVRKDPSQLLVEFSRRAGELEAKIRRGEKALREVEEKLRRLEVTIALRSRKARALVRRREWYEKYHWLITKSGFLAVGGRDASQNESVVKRYLNEKRIFMHADIHGAPIVVLFAEGHEPPEDDLHDAALLTAAYSKAWKSGFGSIDVYWVWGGQVSKSAPAGEYLARGAFMVYGKRNYIRSVELRLGIGVGVEEEYPVIIVGPPKLVKKRSIVYAVLVPGDEDPSKLAVRLRKVFIQKSGEDYSGLIEALDVNEVRTRIPGRSRVIHVGRGDREEPPRPLKVLPGIS